MTNNTLSCCPMSCFPEYHYQGCFLLVSGFCGQQGPIGMVCTILRLSLCPWWPWTVLDYACHSGLIISGTASMHFQKCLGLDIKLHVTQSLLSISRSSWTHLFLSIHTRSLLSQDYFISCIHTHYFPIPHHGIDVLPAIDQVITTAIKMNLQLFSLVSHIL